MVLAFIGLLFARRHAQSARLLALPRLSLSYTCCGARFGSIPRIGTSEASCVRRSRSELLTTNTDIQVSLHWPYGTPDVSRFLLQGVVLRRLWEGEG
jgi:hypothetical protein